MRGVTRHIPDRFRAVVGSPWLRVAGTVAAVAVLARIATEESRQALQKLTEGEPAARLTREAKLALNRVTRPLAAAK